MIMAGALVLFMIPGLCWHIPFTWFLYLTHAYAPSFSIFWLGQKTL